MDSDYQGTASQEEITQPTRRRSVWLKFAWELIETIILAIALYFLIDTVVGRVRVENISMKPTLQEGEFILVNKMAYKLGQYERGDVIVFHYPRNPEEDYIKRVIGLPGDQVSVRNGEVYVNGQRLDEPYIAAPPTYNNDWVIPDNSLFVLGDNRNQSSDSHSWGYVPFENVIGKALVVYWPLADLKLLNEVPVVNAAN